MATRRSRLVGFATLATFVATFALPFVTPRHHFGDDVDAGWGEIRLGFGHPTTQVEQVYPASPDQHCAICHWVRVFRGTALADTFVYSPVLAPAGIVANTSDSDSSLSVLAGTPRGPPTSL